MIESMMSFRGVSFDKTVVFSGDTSDTRAARGFWFLGYFGHTDVHTLDGGIRAWREAGYTLTTEAKLAKQAAFEARLRPQTLATYHDIRERLARDDAVLLDVRSEGEYRGTSVRAACGGAIPGAIHLEFVHNVDATGRFKPAGELRRQYEALGITPDKDVICF
jgi:thiosulfate/3-mercaptopyruvate sulfurtransferase